MNYLGEHIDNKFGSCDVPFDGHVAEIKPYEEQLDILSKIFQPAIEAIQSLIPTIKTLANNIGKISDEIIKCYPNKRVVYLASHSKKKRTRKKNTNRIIREVIANGTREKF